MGYSTSQYMNSPAIQIKVGAKYIKSRYGSPVQRVGVLALAPLVLGGS